MIPLLKRLFASFFYDELAVTRWLRGSAHTFALSGAVFADQIGTLIGAPGAVRTIKVASLMCAFLAGSLTAGEKNAKP